MRRKSSRNASKASSEKVSEPTRKSRRHSKRRKRSSSRSSSEESNDTEPKTLVQKDTEVTAEDTPTAKNEENPDGEESVWTVSSSETTSGEIQKLKICLTKPTPSPEKPEHSSRRRRNKSGSHAEEDIASPDEKTSRKSRHRGTTEEQEEQPEDVEDKKGKGKSKTKHRSKSEKSPKIQDVEEQTQSDISENAQVTPQSPQAAIDIRVDNENLSTTENEIVGNDETKSVPQSTNNTSESTSENVGQKSPDKIAETDNSRTLQSKHDSGNSKVRNDSHDSQMDFRGFEVNEQCNTEQEEPESITKENVSVQEEIQEQVDEKQMSADQVAVSPAPVDDNSSDVGNKSQEDRSPEDDNKNENTDKIDEEQQNVEAASEVVIESETQETQIQQQEEEHVDNKPEYENKPDTETEETSESLQKEEHHKSPLRRESKAESSTSDEMEHTEEVSEAVESQDASVYNKDESSMKSAAMEESQSQRSDEDSRSADVIIIDANSSLNKEDTSFNLTQSFSPDVREMVEENKELQSLKEEISNLFPTPAKTQRRRKWGNTLAGLELVKSHLRIIDIETIKQFCPDLQFLEESELKMEIREGKDRRKSITDQKEKRTDRKVSIDYKSGSERDDKRLDTQSSVNSSEMEEANEPEIDNSNIIAMNRKISIVDDTASKLKPPPSPAKNPISEVLYITNLVRPFTLKQLKELLERTGKIRENGFWTDRIKSKCYVYYETIEEAETTRNALHGVNWPIGNGKKLIIDYATPDDLEKARNPTPPTPPPVLPEQKIPEKENQVPVKRHKPDEVEKVVKERERHRSETHVREWDIGKEDLHRLRSRSRERNDRSDKRRHRRTPSPDDDFISRKQRKKEEEVPQKLMDDLFRKTKTTPSIYWLPLTPEEIATKQQQRLLRMAEHKRRMEESSRSRVDYGRGAPYRRRYD
ncbi:hypothetical protein ILUMI_07503 [Ignelater luminosus]|uniref:RRM domain-containing protein n=1 Tax=Ignelater luminosus TaxID=2038154 RepID=A0A8K0D6C9_IGNLU|nr:hypothetical protein ILUMI_07503 [Ignelater luminosus]